MAKKDKASQDGSVESGSSQDDQSWEVIHGSTSSESVSSQETAPATTKNTTVSDDVQQQQQQQQLELHEEANTVSDPQREPPNDERPRPTLFQKMKSIMFNMMIFWMLSRFFFSGGQKGANQGASKGPVDPSLSRANTNLFEKGFAMDLYVYISEDSYEPDFFDDRELRWIQRNIIFDDWTQGPNKDSTFRTEIDIELSPKVQNNGSLWLHSYFVKSGFIPFEATRTAENFSPIYTVHKKKQLNKYKKRKYKDTHNLITGKTEKSTEEQEKIRNKIKEEIVSHWHPNLTINMVYDHTMWSPASVPSTLKEFIEFEPTTGKYYPIVYMNDYWNLQRDYMPINETVKKVHLSLTYQPIGLMKWQMYAAQGMQNKWSNMLASDALENDAEQDYIKEALLDTSPILLGLTIVVSIAHSVFEFLAFKNDIQFWKDRKSLEGLSVRSVFFNLFQSVVVLLYVMDNDTNTMIRVSIGIGLLIELWKIPKVVNIKVDRNNKLLGIFPKISFEDKGSYVESSTKEYDMMAYKYLSWVIFPLFVGYAIYSLVYNEHKGWYSFTLNMTYGFLLAFGFIMMTPQLFINYKLKSVAHLPWRMLSYKFLNTFIDDIFAFVIKMPFMYRIGCFRDDIIFFIYLYQRWIYRVDPKRVNEFGVSGDDLEGKTKTDGDQKAIASKESEDASTRPVQKAKKSKADKKRD
jgi:hypothetical protein